MDSTKPSEKELLNACVQGSKEAWDTFVEKYTNLIYHAINKTLKTYYADHLYQDINDIHNNVFLSLMKNDYRKLRQYEGRNGCTVSSWLMIVTTNFTLNFIKKSKATYIKSFKARSQSLLAVPTNPEIIQAVASKNDRIVDPLL